MSILLSICKHLKPPKASKCQLTSKHIIERKNVIYLDHKFSCLHDYKYYPEIQIAFICEKTKDNLVLIKDLVIKMSRFFKEERNIIPAFKLIHYGCINEEKSYFINDKLIKAYIDKICNFNAGTYLYLHGLSRALD